MEKRRFPGSPVRLAAATLLLDFLQEDGAARSFSQMFLWQPLDVGTTAMGMKLISPGFDPGDLKTLYR
jgi:hypothetical protein